MFISVSLIIGSVHWAPGQFTLDEIQCHTRDIPFEKVHDYSEITIVFSYLGERNDIFITNLKVFCFLNDLTRSIMSMYHNLSIQCELNRNWLEGTQ